MTDSIFGNPEGQQSAPTSPVTPDGATSQQQDGNNAEPKQPASDPYADLLAAIQQEDGRQKYANTEEALKALPHAQNHIKELTDKLKELEQKAEEAESVEEVLKRIQSKQATDEKPSTQELDETKLAEILDRKLTQREKETLQKTNQQEVVKSLENAFGEKAREAYENKAAELGLDVATLNQLARTSPKAVLQYFGLSQAKAPSSGLGKSSVNTSAMDMRPRSEEDPMARFRSSDSELLTKWRKAASKIEV